MPNQIDTSVRPYYDDYNEQKDFIKILFKPGVSIQAREVNQLQTMYQKQISRFADHVFKNGSVVIPGNLIPDFEYKYLKIESNFADGSQEDLNSSLSSYIGKRVKKKSGTLEAIIRNAVSAENSDPSTLYIDYTNQEGTDNDVSEFGSSEVLQILDTDDSVIREITTVSSDPVGKGTAVHVKQGVFYVNEYFHLVLDQTLIVSKYSNAPSLSVGFDVRDDIVTSGEDSSLLDNAVGFSNENAPGADRYKSELVLTTKTLNSTGTELGTNETGTYVQLIRIVNGVVQEIARTPTYSIIEESAARRSNETNGSFIIDPFTLSFEAHLKTNFYPGRFTSAQGGSADKFVYALDKGQAYINGFRMEKRTSSYLSADRARTADHIKTRNNVPTTCDLGQYVLGTMSTSDDALPALTDYPEIEIFDNSSSPVKIGTCRIRAIRHETSNTYRFYIFAIDMDSGKTFIEDAKSLRYTDASYANFNAVLEQSNSKAVIYNPVDSAAIFPIGYGPTKAIKDVSYTTTENFDADASGSPASFTIATGASNRTFLDSNIIVVNITDGNIVADADYSTNFQSSNTQITVSGAGITSGKRYRIFVDVQNASISDSTTYKLRTKTLQTKDLTGVAAASEISLTVPDAISIVVTDSNDNDVSYKYSLDTGQRDGFYDIAKIILAPGQTQTGNLDITVTYFSHGEGDYFAANSYSSDDYSKIQFYRSSNGELLDLTDCLDFRPTISTDGTFTGAGAVTGNNVSPNTLFNSDVEYYVGRYDLIVLNSDGDFQVVSGEPDDFPQKPENPTSGLVLHEVKVPAYTYELKSIRATSLEHRRYTMRDVAKLDKRIENVEYYTALNLLEKDTADLSILDANGNEKFKNGFFIDNFSDQSRGDIQNQAYQFSIDVDFGEGHPEVSTKNVMLGADSVNSSNVTIHDNGVVTLPYSEETWAAQTQATADISVNPYAMYFWRGTLELTPETDVWFSTEFAPDIVVNNGTFGNVGTSPANVGTVWNNWQTVWSGTDFDVTGVESQRVREWRGGSRDRSLQIHRAVVRRRQDIQSGAIAGDADDLANLDPGRFRWVDQEVATIARRTTTVQERTGTRTFVSSSVQRREVDNRVISRAVIPWIRARRVNFVAEGLKPESKFWVFFDDVDVSEHCAQTGPDASRDKGEFLVTNASGQVEGYFDIPNTPEQRFRTGTRELRLYNVSDPLSDAGDSVATAEYTAEGTLETRQRTIEATRVSRLVTQTVRERRTETDVQENEFTRRNVLTGWIDPLAQSFLTDQRGGSFLTSIEVAFTAKDDNIPVTLQVRNMVNGFPGQEILPFGEVTLYPGDVTVDESGITWTKFSFKSPVYIQEQVEYCFVLVSNSNDYRVRIANMAEQDITTGTFVSKQPYMGVFFKSQNGTTWSEDQDADMTFKINRAKFTQTSGSLRTTPDVPDYESGFESDPFKTTVLDPFEALSGSSTLKIFHPNHGMYPGNEVTITVPDSNSVVFGGINVQDDLDGNTYTVAKVINNDEYYIDLSGQSITATDSGRFGGSSIQLTTNVAYDILQINSTNLTPAKTKLTPKIKTTNHNVAASRSLDSAFTKVTMNQNIYFEDTRSLIEGVDDFQLEIDFSTDRDNLSPMIDLERLSGFFSRNRINDIQDTTENGDYDSWVTYVSDEKDLSSSFARYISKTITLETPANSIHVFIDANRRFGSDIEVWYKTLGIDDTQQIDNTDWTEMTRESYPSISTIVGDFKEYEWKVEGLDDYTSYKIKIVLKSDNTASAPSVKNFRAIAAAE